MSSLRERLSEYTWCPSLNNLLYGLIIKFVTETCKNIHEPVKAFLARNTTHTLRAEELLLRWLRLPIELPSVISSYLTR